MSRSILMPANNASSCISIKKRHLLYTVIFLLFTTAAAAQANEDDFIIDVAPQLSLPTGALKQTSRFGYGLHLGVQCTTTEKLRIIAGVTGVSYGGKSNADYPGIDDNRYLYDLLQVTAGAKYFYYRGLFCAAQAGPVFSVWSPTRGTGFYYAPMLGFEFEANTDYDISLRYDTNTIKGKSLNAVSLSITYQF